jgi:release factor glutamine methyltransferase
VTRGLLPTEEGGPARRPPAPGPRELIDGLAAELEAGGIHGARHEAERILAHVLGISRTDLALRSAPSISPEDAGRIADLSRRRLAGVPLQHIEGTVAFRDLILVCDGRALVPRPETEQLVQKVVDWVRDSGAIGGVRRVVRREAKDAATLDVALDIGTGSGAIALSLLHEGIVGRAVAVDVSKNALEQAAENAARLGLTERIELRETEGSPWDAIGSDETFDVIVSNPPYVADAVVQTLPTEVRDHDPYLALAGGADGLDLVREVVAGAPRHLGPGGGLFLEVGADQGERVRSLLAADTSWARVEVMPDLAGRERFVVALS